MVRTEDFNSKAHEPDVNTAVIEALERIRMRMRTHHYVPTQTALREAAREEFDSITPEFACALRDALNEWRQSISPIYDTEEVLGIREEQQLSAPQHRNSPAPLTGRTNE